MARRNSTRKASRKNRRQNSNSGYNMMNVEEPLSSANPAPAPPAPAAAPPAPAAAPATVAANEEQVGGKRKSRKQGKRKLSPALKAWNEKVMAIYREMKKKNPNIRLMDAMKEAKKRS